MLLCPWDFPDKNTGVGSHFLLQGIFLTQELNPSLLHLYCLNHQGLNHKLYFFFLNKITRGCVGAFEMSCIGEKGRWKLDPVLGSVHICRWGFGNHLTSQEYPRRIRKIQRLNLKEQDKRHPIRPQKQL